MILMVIAELTDDDEKAFMLSLYKDYYGLVRKTLYSITQDQKDLLYFKYVGNG